MKTATAQGVVEDAKSDNQIIDELANFLGVQDEPPVEEEPTQAAQEEEDSTVNDDEDLSRETEADQDMDVSERDESDDDEGEPVDGEPAEDERWMPESLEELAEALEVEPDVLNKAIKVHTKVDGEEGEATLGDLLKSYQLEGTLNKRLEAVANERKQFETVRNEQLQTLQQKAQEADDLVSAVEQMLVADFQSVDWSDLQENDPTEYLMQQQRLQQRYAQLQTAKKQIEDTRKTDAEKMQQDNQQAVQQYLQQQAGALVEKIPEWRDHSKMQEGLKQVADYMKSQGVSDQELAMIADHRIYVMAQKAMMYDNVQTKANPKAKKMKSKPKFVPPGARKNKAGTSEKAKKAAFNRAKKLQTDDAWTEALMQKLS